MEDLLFIEKAFGVMMKEKQEKKKKRNRATSSFQFPKYEISSGFNNSTRQLSQRSIAIYFYQNQFKNIFHEDFLKDSDQEITLVRS
jgi:hypothetical protein